MRPYVFKIAAGVEQPEYFGDGRNYIRLNSTATVNVTVKDPDNNQEYTLAPGDDVLFAPFQELRISHDGASDTAFTLYVGRNTKAGSAAVSGNIQPVGGSANLANKPIFIPDPRTLVTHYGGTITNTVSTIVAPAANINGVRVDAINLHNHAANGQGMVCAKATTPTAYNDSAARSLFTLYVNSTIPFCYIDKIDRALILPPGEGLFTIASIAAFCNISIEHEVL